jgi:hypothetical protein
MLTYIIIRGFQTLKQYLIQKWNSRKEESDLNEKHIFLNKL